MYFFIFFTIFISHVFYRDAAILFIIFLMYDFLGKMVLIIFVATIDDFIIFFIHKNIFF